MFVFFSFRRKKNLWLEVHKDHIGLEKPQERRRERERHECLETNVRKTGAGIEMDKHRKSTSRCAHKIRSQQDKAD